MDGKILKFDLSNDKLPNITTPQTGGIAEFKDQRAPRRANEHFRLYRHSLAPSGDELVAEILKTEKYQKAVRRINVPSSADT